MHELPIFEVTLKRNQIVFLKCGIQARNANDAAGLARLAHPDCEPDAVEELDCLGRCHRCGRDLIEGDDVARVRGKAYCRQHVPGWWDWLFARW